MARLRNVGISGIVTGIRWKTRTYCYDNNMATTNAAEVDEREELEAQEEDQYAEISLEDLLESLEKIRFGQRILKFVPFQQHV